MRIVLAIYAAVLGMSIGWRPVVAAPPLALNSFDDWSAYQLAPLPNLTRDANVGAVPYDSLAETDAVASYPTHDLEEPVEDGRWDWQGELAQPGVTDYHNPVGDYPTGVAYGGAPWTWQILPRGLIYRSYYASVKEPKFRSVWNRISGDQWVWDANLGGRVGVLRYGTPGTYFPQGWQLDMEGAALLRLLPESKSDLAGTDYRFGIPLTYGAGRWQFKLAYYHVSSHVGDELILRHGAGRINFVRDAVALGVSYHPWDDLRLYAEATYAAIHHEVALPWEFQFGADYSPYCPSGFWPDPFAAINGHIREELDFGGQVVVQAGVQWRGEAGGSTFRMGVEYFNGASDQYQFFGVEENKIGFGLWYDF